MSLEVLGRVRQETINIIVSGLLIRGWLRIPTQLQEGFVEAGVVGDDVLILVLLEGMVRLARIPASHLHWMGVQLDFLL